MELAFFHTAEIHCSAFDAIVERLAPGAQTIHALNPDLLEIARQDGLEAVRARAFDEFEALVQADALLCTCSTLGPLADEFARNAPHILRIDRPLMEAAATSQAPLLVFCLESAKVQTVSLFNEVAGGARGAPHTLQCEGTWEYFVRGDRESFLRAIGKAVSAEIATGVRPSAIVLAQASMAGAAPLLEEYGVPILSAPEIAVRRMIEVAKGL